MRKKRKLPKVPSPLDYVTETNPNLMSNVGCTFDIMGGDAVKGSRGETIINGGFGGMVAVVGEANVGKTTLLAFLALTCTARYSSFNFQFDSEGTGQVTRIIKLGSYIQDLDPLELIAEDTQQYFRTDNKIDGPTWHTSVVDWAKEASGFSKKKYKHIETPFLNPKGVVIHDLRKHTATIDSITYFKTSDQVDKVEGVEAGDSKKNMMYMHMAGTQQDILIQANLATARFGMNYLVAAHSKERPRLDKYAANPSQLKGLKTDHRIKGGGNAIVDLPTSIWYIRDKTTFWNSSKDKNPRYPVSDSLQGVLDPDLVFQTVQNLRGKSGLTDLQFPIVLSQANGILVGLTYLENIKAFNNYGLLELTTNRIYACAILPETKWQRTTVREKSLNDRVLLKALHYTYELAYIAHHMDHHAKLLMTPEELYSTLKEMGYDWDRLLHEDVREWWCYREDEAFFGNEYLSTFDLLRMARGLYVPHWFSKEEKAKIDLSKAKVVEGLV